MNIRNVIPIVIIIVLLLLLRNTAVSIKNIFQNEGTVQDLQHELNTKKQEHSYLAQRLSYVKSIEFVEREARDKLGLVQESEYPVFVVPPFNEDSADTVEETDNWKKWKAVFRL